MFCQIPQVIAVDIAVNVQKPKYYCNTHNQLLLVFIVHCSLCFTLFFQGGNNVLKNIFIFIKNVSIKNP